MCCYGLMRRQRFLLLLYSTATVKALPVLQLVAFILYGSAVCARYSAFFGLTQYFALSQELASAPKKLETRVKRFFSAKKDRLTDIVPRFVLVNGMES